MQAIAAIILPIFCCHHTHSPSIKTASLRTVPAALLRLQHHANCSTMQTLRITPVPGGKTRSDNGFQHLFASARARLSFTSSIAAVTVTSHPSVTNRLCGCSAFLTPRITWLAGIINSAFGRIWLLASSDSLHLIICGVTHNNQMYVEGGKDEGLKSAGEHNN